MFPNLDKILSEKVNLSKKFTALFKHSYMDLMSSWPHLFSGKHSQCFEMEKVSKEESSSKFLKVFYLKMLLGNTFLEYKYLRNKSNMKYCNKVIQL